MYFTDILLLTLQHMLLVNFNVSFKTMYTLQNINSGETTERELYNLLRSLTQKRESVCNSVNSLIVVF